MPIILGEDAQDKSTFVVKVYFYDEDDAPVVPTSASWSLYDANEQVINSRLNIPIAGLDTSVDIVLSGDDLKYSDDPFRQLAISATYDSTLGIGLPLTGEINFEIEDVAGQT